MKKKQVLIRIILGSLFLWGYQPANPAQHFQESATDSISGEQDWISFMEEISENSEDERNAAEWQNIFSDLSENPIPLNTATKEMLESIPFLSEKQVEALSYYIYRYGPIVSLSELMLVEGMDEQTIRWLKPFVCLGKATPFPIETPSLKNALKYGRQEIRTRIGRSLQEKAGYANTLDSTLTDKSYAGDPYQAYFRYGFNYKGKMQWGFVLEKDAGEKIWNKKNKGIDYTSFHFVLKDQKKIKTLILGDYNLRFGQGLVCASTFSLGKSVTGVSPEQTGENLSRHFSTSESGFFRGIGAKFILKPFVRQTSETKGRFGVDMITFASLRNLDANISNGSFTSVSSSELHRTKAESDIKDQLKLNTFGIHLTFRTDKSQLGLTGMTYAFNTNYDPTWKPYNCFYFRGKQGKNLAIDYRLRYKGLLLFGEYAIDEKKRTAFLSGLTLKPYSILDLSLMVRNYDVAYSAYFGKALSEGSTIQNEYGFFAICEWRFVKNWRINAYYDIFVFPWLKYGINAPSSGFDYALQSTWTPSSESQVVIRFKAKAKDKNESEDKSTITSVKRQIKNQLRIQISSKHRCWTFKTALDVNSIEIPSYKSKNWGFSASQEIDYSLNDKPVSFSIKYALFDIDHFDNRVYSYEKDLPGAFSMTPFYGQGNRFSLLLKSKITKATSIQIKIGHSVYRDRQQVGTALEQVQGSRLTDIRGLFLWKF